MKLKGQVAVVTGSARGSFMAAEVVENDDVAGLDSANLNKPSNYIG